MVYDDEDKDCVASERVCLSVMCTTDMALVLPGIGVCFGRTVGQLVLEKRGQVFTPRGLKVPRCIHSTWELWCCEFQKGAGNFAQYPFEIHSTTAPKYIIHRIIFGNSFWSTLRSTREVLVMKQKTWRVLLVDLGVDQNRLSKIIGLM